MSDQIVAISFASLACLLGLGHVVRSKVTLLQQLFLPSSLIGGILGCALLQTLQAVELQSAAAMLSAGWLDLPAVLTNFVFACMVIGQPLPSPREVVEQAGPQFLYGQCVVWGQYSVCLLLTGAWLIPAAGHADPNTASSNTVNGTPSTVNGSVISPVIAAVVPIGFEGGHGVVAGLKQSFGVAGFPAGYDLALVASTLGLLLGAIAGTGAIGLARRKGLLLAKGEGRQGQGEGRQGLADREGRPLQEEAQRVRPTSMGYETVSVVSLDSLAFHLVPIGLAVLFGWLCKVGLTLLDSTNDWLREYRFFESFPAFPFTLCGGLLIQAVVDRYEAKQQNLVPEPPRQSQYGSTPDDASTAAPPPPVEVKLFDRRTIEHIGATCQDFLITSAMATLSFSEGAQSSLGPFLLLVVATAAWCMAALVLIAPWVLPDFWLERGICELGSSMGVTATALLLCRMLDPHNETPVLASFCYKQSLHVLIVGGGIFTSSVVPMLAVFGVWPVLAITVTCFVLCSVGAYCLGKSQRDSRDAAAPRSLGQKSSAFVSVSARRSLSSRSSWGSMENGSELLSGE